MCIIVVKPCGVAMPDYSILETCFNNNPDGAGLMLYRHGEKTLTIDKGYFDFKSFWDALQAYNPQYQDIVVMHFRIATSGLIDESCCHPFPISMDVAQLRAPQIVCSSAIAHNGVLGSGTKDLSDTMLYIRDKLAPAYLAGADIDPVSPGNRICLLDAEHNTMLLHGEWIDDNGIMYSNSSYKPYVWDYPTKTQDDIFIPLDFCPYCETVGNKMISKYHELYECKECHTIFDKYGGVIL